MEDGALKGRGVNGRQLCSEWICNLACGLGICLGGDEWSQTAVFGFVPGILEGARGMHPCAKVGACHASDKPEMPHFRSLSLYCTAF